MKSDELKVPHRETSAEELASALTHGAGLLLSVIGVLLLIIFAGLAADPRRIVCVCIYGVTLMLMFAASTCYHCVHAPRLKRALRLFDHSSIYLLIAGTYTPVLLVLIRGGWGWSLFGVIWGLAIFGLIAKLFFIDRYELLSVIIYVAMGWLALVALKPMFTSIHPRALALLFAGGFAYTAGIVFYLWDRLPFNHAIWHLFVIAGSAFHFFAILLYVLPPTR